MEEKEREKNLNESCFVKPSRKSIDICTNNFDIQRFKNLTKFEHCVSSFAATEADRHYLLCHGKYPQLQLENRKGIKDNMCIYRE